METRDSRLPENVDRVLDFLDKHAEIRLRQNFRAQTGDVPTKGKSSINVRLLSYSFR